MYFGRSPLKCVNCLALLVNWIFILVNWIFIFFPPHTQPIQNQKCLRERYGQVILSLILSFGGRDFLFSLLTFLNTHVSTGTILWALRCLRTHYSLKVTRNLGLIRNLGANSQDQVMGISTPIQKSVFLFWQKIEKVLATVDWSIFKATGDVYHWKG